MAAILGKLHDYNGFSISVDEDGVFHASALNSPIYQKTSLAALKKELRDKHAKPQCAIPALHIDHRGVIEHVTIAGLVDTSYGGFVTDQGRGYSSEMYHPDEKVETKINDLRERIEQLQRVLVAERSKLVGITKAEVREALECGHNDVVMTVSPQLDKHLHHITVILNRRGIKMAKSDVQEHVFFLNWNTVPDAVVDFERMAGDTLCPECGNSVYKHPVDREHCDYNGMPFLHILCNGTRAKL